MVRYAVAITHPTWHKSPTTDLFDRCWDKIKVIILIYTSIDSHEIEVKMVTTLNKPSSLIHEIQIEKVGDWNLFKFSEPLQLRMENLLEKKKADQIDLAEIAELDTIGELDRIFTHINAMLAAQNVH